MLAEKQELGKDKNELPIDGETVKALTQENEQIKSELEQSSEQMEKLSEQLNEEKERYLRLMAEYDNFRKRSVKEKQQAYTDAKADALTAFLPIIDNLERAMESSVEGESLLEGVQMTLRQTQEILENCGIEEIEAMGTKFDPQLHNAMMHIEDEAFGEAQICAVFQKGYKIGDRVIRHSMVQVAN